MLTSLALMFLLGMFLGWFFQRLHLPRLLGMLITGIIVGPYMGNLLDVNTLAISPDLRRLALIIILTTAGLSLDINDLKRVGRPAFLMCFVPACFEMAGMMLIAPALLHISVMEAAVMGAVIAAVSPAVVVPKMLRLMEEGCGTDKSIPQMIMAGASVDDVFVIVIFTAVVGMAQGRDISAVSALQIPMSIATGVTVGVLAGIVLHKAFAKIHIRDSAKVVILLSISFLLAALEDANLLPFSGLLAVMSIGVTVQKKNATLADRLSRKYAKLWVGAEVLLFALVGATVDLQYALAAGATAIAVIFAVVGFRMVGVWVCLVKTSLSIRERVFCMIAYMPKATVQAAIGSIPLSMGFACGHVILTVAVLSILITAPLGALGVELSYKRLLGGR